MSRKVIIAGGSGFVGRELVAFFAKQGYEIVVLSRSQKPVENGRVVVWDGKNLGPWSQELEGAKAVINLCGSPIANLWTESYKKELYDSRVTPTSLIGQAISQATLPPEVWVNASGVGFYGETGNQMVTESFPPGKDFLGELSQAWEGAMQAHPTPKTRKVILRLGVVLGDGGALEKLVDLTKKYLGSPVGNGKQWMSWIHVHDVARMFEWAISSPISGAVNCVSPDPRTNSDLMAALRQKFGRPFVPPPPLPLLRIATRLMGTQVDLLLISNRALPTLAEAQGFTFEFPTLESAFDNLLNDTPPEWKREAKAR
ncbi:MAG: TIGR01777 family oxidoreductase [Fimbriimonadaceae bacterium]|nr:TIGR01777 family oxidoreductase [Fimbriimonadaceae bacterium]